MRDILMAEARRNNWDRVRRMCSKMMEQAAEGDVRSADWVMDRILGKPTMTVDAPQGALVIAWAGSSMMHAAVPRETLADQSTIEHAPQAQTMPAPITHSGDMESPSGSPVEKAEPGPQSEESTGGS